MRGNNSNTETMFVYLSPEVFVPKNHPLRPILSMSAKSYGHPY
jgi:hypothetical protein